MTDETKLAELKPCPFCGSRPKGWDIGAAQGRSPRWLLECANSECLVFVEAECPTEAEAIAAWNTRPVPDDVVGVVERLKDPTAVHVNMLAGNIAKPSPTQIWHIYGSALIDEIPAALLTSLASVRDDGWLPIEQAPIWQVAVVTDGNHAAIAQKALTDWGSHYWATDPEDCLEWEPTHWLPAPPTNGGK